MPIISLPVQLPSQVGNNPNLKMMATTDNLATISAAAYLNQYDLQSNPIASNDIIFALYSYNLQTNSGTFGIFQPSISNGVITLNQQGNEGGVTLPVVSGNVPVFNGTLGQIKDSGAALSNTADPFLVSSPGSLTIGNFPKLGDAKGTITNGLPPSAAGNAFVVVSPGSLTAGNFPNLADANGTIATGLPPSAAGNAFVVVSPGTLTAGNLAKFNDVNGTLADSGIAALSIGTTQTISVILSAATVNAAFGAPAQIIAAPGAGKAIVVLNAQIYTSVSTVFAGGGVAIVQYTNTIYGAGVDALTATIPAAEITAAASQIYTLNGIASASVLTGITNQGIFFSNATGAFTGGAGSTVTITLQYTTLTATV